MFNQGNVGAYLIDGQKVHPKSMFDRHGTHARDQIKKIYPSMQLFYTKGKHKYLMPLQKDMRDKILLLSKPYPKREKQAMAVPTEQRRCDTDLHAPHI